MPNQTLGQLLSRSLAGRGVEPMHAIILGQGKSVYHLARRFISKGYHTTIISRDAAAARNFSRKLKATVVHGDGTDPGVLEEAGARRASILVSLMMEDQDNLVACQLAKEMFGVPRTVALVLDPENETVFRQLGVTVAISVAHMLSQIIEEQVSYEDVINLTSLAQGKVALTEVILTETAPAVDRELRELGLPRNALVATVLRNDEVIIPHGETRLRLYDRLLILTQPGNHGQVLRALLGEGE
ncbi:MAG: TrkA family potassium uptake protein [Caldilineae bacterium]|nr:MAG: TrkA family potassium uptake protein [Caldilineae bacterium]